MENLAAQCFAFFFAGYSTQNLTLSAALLELARNPDIQYKLRQEVDETFEANNGEIGYDAVNKMKYMEQVVSGISASHSLSPLLLHIFSISKQNFRNHSMLPRPADYPQAMRRRL